MAEPPKQDGSILWPGWLGPNRDGWVPHFQPPQAWPEKLQEIWQTEVGTGYGSPLVADGLVYQHARQGEDEVVWCLELKTVEGHSALKLQSRTHSMGSP